MLLDIFPKEDFMYIEICVNKLTINIFNNVKKISLDSFVRHFRNFSANVLRIHSHPS